MSRLCPEMTLHLRIEVAADMVGKGHSILTSTVMTDPWMGLKLCLSLPSVAAKTRF